MGITVTRTKVALDRKPWWLHWWFRDLRYRWDARKLGVAYAYTVRFRSLPRWWLLGGRNVTHTSPVYAERDDA